MKKGKPHKIVASARQALAHARGEADEVVSVTRFEPVFRFACGDRVKDIVTGYKGVIMARTEWANGCLRYTVQAEGLKDGAPVDALAIDEEHLVTAGKPLVVERRSGTPPGGGGRADPQRPRDPTR